MYSYAHFEESYRDVRDVFDFENKPTLTHIEIRIPAKSHEGSNNVGLTYSYLDANNRFFLVKLSYDYYDIPISIKC